MGQRNYQPKHRTTNTGHRTLNLERDKRQALYQADGWRKFSADFIKENPECYSCGDKASVVDHLVPHQGDLSLFEKSGNHLPLCVKCHNTVTTKFDRNFKRGDTPTEKIKWLNDNRSMNQTLLDRKFKSVRVIPYRRNK